MITYDNMEVKIMELIILPEIQRRLMPLQPEELAELERSVLEEGIRDPLVVWRKDGQLILVDGHHRYELAKKYGLKFQIVEREFRDLDEVLIWVDRNQLGRRNLTDAERSIVRARIYEIKKKPRGRPPKEENVQNLHIFSEEEKDISEDTATEVAQQTGVSRRTILNDVKFKEAWERLQEISPKAAEIVLRDEVRDAKTQLPKVPPEVLPFVAKKIEEGARSIKQILMEWRQEQKEQRLKERAEAATKLDQPFVLHCCDIRDAYQVVPAESVDLIITDPPYGRDYLPLYEELSKFASHALKEGGICLVMTGQSYLPEVLSLLTKHLDYVWMLAYYLQPPAPFIKHRNIANNWKPIVYLAKGKPFAGQVNDVIISKEPEKRDHEWQQNLEAFLELVRRFARPKMVICDPFCGTGTTGVAALLNGCRFIGLDADREVLEVAQKRLDELVG
jgi:16S rRNA G966 N2-methylase RsmD